MKYHILECFKKFKLMKLSLDEILEGKGLPIKPMSQGLISMKFISAIKESETNKVKSMLL